MALICACVGCWAKAGAAKPSKASVRITVGWRKLRAGFMSLTPVRFLRIRAAHFDPTPYCWACASTTLRQASLNWSRCWERQARARPPPGLVPLQNFWKSARHAARSAAVCANALVAIKLMDRITQRPTKRISTSLDVFCLLAKSTGRSTNVKLKIDTLKMIRKHQIMEC